MHSNGKSDSAISYSIIFISLEIKNKIASQFQSNGMVYGCEVPIIPAYINPFDSVSILLNKDYGSIKAGQSFISYLGFGETKRTVTNKDIISAINAHNSSYFSLLNPPNQTDTFQFTFVFKDSRDSIFKAISKPIIISP